MLEDDGITFTRLDIGDLPAVNLLVLLGVIERFLDHLDILLGRGIEWIAKKCLC